MSSLIIVIINYYKKIGEDQDGRRENERSSFIYLQTNFDI